MLKAESTKIFPTALHLTCQWVRDYSLLFPYLKENFLTAVQVVGIVSLPVCFSPVQPVIQNRSEVAEQPQSCWTPEKAFVRLSPNGRNNCWIQCLAFTIHLLNLCVSTVHLSQLHLQGQGVTVTWELSHLEDQPGNSDLFPTSRLGRC